MEDIRKYPSYIHATDVKFSKNKKELLVNLGNDHIYLFNTKKNNHTIMDLPG